MTRRIIVLLAVVVVCAGGVVGGFLISAGGGSKEPAVPKAWRNSILDEATRQGVISGYRLAELVPGQHLTYTADNGDISLNYTGCIGNASCPATITRVGIQYRASAASDARSILGIAQAFYGGRNGLRLHPIEFTLVA